MTFTNPSSPSAWRSSFAKIALEWLPNILVLAILLGIAWMGHLTHWKMPKFEDVISGKLFAGHAGHDEHGHEATGHVSQFVELNAKQSRLNDELEFAVAERRPLREKIAANGRIIYDMTRLAQLSPRSAGVVWRIEKHAGQSVQAGEVLAIIDSREVGDAKAEYLSATAEYEHRFSAKERLQTAGEGISQKLLLEATTELKKARIRKLNAFQSLVNLGLIKSDVTEESLMKMSESDRTRRIKSLGLTPELIEEFSARPISGNLIPLVAPFAGVVVGREIVVGEHASPEKPAMIVADTSTMWIELGVRKEDASVLRLGQEVKFTAVGLPPGLPSKITWISTELDEATHTLTVRAEIDNPIVGEVSPGAEQQQRLLAANTFGKGEICVRQATDALMVPSTALHHDGKRIIVFVPDSTAKSFEPRAVSVGVSDGGWTEVVSGLQDGDRVVTHGSVSLKSEMAKRRADTGEEPAPPAQPTTTNNTGSQPKKGDLSHL